MAMGRQIRFGVRAELAGVRLVLVIVGAWFALACSSGGAKQQSDVLPPLSLACESDSECAAGAVCDPFNGCVGCLFDSQCPAGNHCVARTCVEAQACTADANCAGTATPACDPDARVCVACTETAGCGDNQMCESGVCVDYKPCVNTRDCGAGRVCDREHGRCVQCVGKGDCAEGQSCVDYQCTPNCDSDKDCAPLNLLCDPVHGYCSECVYAIDCPDVYHCDSGKCVLDVCKAGDSRCVEDPKQYQRCTADGAGWELVSCDSGSSCSQTASYNAVCAPWVCKPGVVACDDTNTKLVRCADDGLSVQPQTDCAAEGGACESASCRDVTCEANKAFCKDASIYQCDATGTSFSVVQACDRAEFCDPTTVQCSPQACTPDAKYCDGDSAVTCKSDGSGPTDGTDCSLTAQACFEGQCLPIACSGPSCVGNEAYRCANNGTSSEYVQTCDSTQFCDAGACKSKICQPGESLCDGQIATTCKADGSGYDVGGTDCAVNGSVCYLGNCLSQVCQDGALFCGANNDVRQCTNNGTDSTPLYSCTRYQYCSDGTCHAQICTPNQPACNAQVATTCNATGSGYGSAGTDCAATGSVCVSGSCKAVVCPAGTFFCGTANDVRACSSDGTSSSLYQTCTANEYCANGACYARLCTPSQPACNGEVATQCNASGSGYTGSGTDCAASGTVCLGGTCLPVICTGTYFCSGGNVFICENKGATSRLYDTCAASEFCKDGLSYCQYDVCTAGSAVCNGTFVTTCKADGSGPNSGGTDCAATGQTCEAGVCKAVVCPAGKNFCLSGNVEACNAVGTSWTRYATCSAAQWCDDTQVSPVCSPDICASGAAACDSEKLATCRSDGGGFTAQTTDCAASGSVCDLVNGCVASAVDSIGTNTTPSSATYGMFVANLIEVRTARRLTKIETYASASGTALFTFSVYSATTATGTYTKIFEKVVTGSGSGSFLSSGDISVPLEKGKFYIIGTLLGAGTTAYALTSGQPDYLSFGRSFSGYSSTSSSLPATISIYSTSTTAWYERLTTTP